MKPAQSLAQISSFSAIPFLFSHASFLHDIPSLLNSFALISALANPLIWTTTGFGQVLMIYQFVPTETAQRRKQGLSEHYCHLNDLGLPGPVHLFTTINTVDMTSKGIVVLDMLDLFISHHAAIGVPTSRMQFLIHINDTIPSMANNPSHADIQNVLTRHGIDTDTQVTFIDENFDEDISISVVNGFMELLPSDAWLLRPEINELFHFPCASYPPAPMKATCGLTIDRLDIPTRNKDINDNGKELSSSDCITNLRGRDGILKQTTVQSRKRMLFPVQVEYPGLGQYNARYSWDNRLEYIDEDNQNGKIARCEEAMGVIEAYMEYRKEEVDSALPVAVRSNAATIEREKCPISKEEGWYNSRFSGLEPVHVVYAANHDSVAGVEACIRSVLAHSSGPIEFYYIGTKPLPSMHFVHWFNLTDIVETYDLEAYMNTNERTDRDDSINLMHSNYARFSLDKIMPAAASKIMYIDVDTIVLCDIYSLVNSVLTDESGNVPIAAIPRYDVDKQDTKKGAGTSVIWGLTESGAKYVEGMNLTKSFNAGVYVADLNVWRQQNLSEKMRKVALLNRELNLYSYGSQPPMNIVIGSNFEDLSIGWNVCPKKKHIDRVREEGEELCLLHFKGNGKPWNGESNLLKTGEWDRFGSRVK